MRRLSLALFLLFFAPSLALADAILYVSPERGNYSIGEVFEVQLLADSGGENINAAEAELLFNTAGLQVEEISSEGSILTQWADEPHFDNEEGSVQFSGWTEKKYNGPKGLLLTIRFKALRNMESNARLLAGAILAADGMGSNIITDMRSGVYDITPHEVEAPPDEEDVQLPVVPRLAQVDATIKEGERIFVKGVANQNAAVHIWFQKGNGPPSLSDAQTDSNGGFTFFSEGPAEAGVYRIWAQSWAFGTQSGLSDILTVTVQRSGAAAAAQSTGEIVSEFFPLFALLILGGVGAGYIMHRHKIARMHRLHH